MARSTYPWLAALIVVALATPGAGAAPVPPAPPAAAAAEPPAPRPTPPIQRLLEEARQQGQAGQARQALSFAEQALSAARQDRDIAGEALAERARALALEQSGRTADAVATWQATAAAWQRVGDGPGQVEALSAAGLLLLPDKPAEAAAFMAQAVALGRAETRRPLAAAAALQAAGRDCTEQNQPAAAREYLRQAAVIYDRLAPGSPKLFTALGTLGAVSYQLSDLPEAGTAYRRALALEEKLAPDSLNLAAVLGNVGLIAYQQGDLAAARQYLLRARTLFQQHAPSSAALANCLNSLGAIAYAQGDQAAAREFYLQALALQQRIAPGSPDEAMSLNNLGNVVSEQGNLALAAKFYRGALAIDEKLAPDSLGTAAQLNNLGDIAAKQGDLAQAREQYQQALRLKEKLAPGSLEVGRTLNNLAIVASKQGDLKAASDYLHPALALFQKLAPGSIDLANSLNNLAQVAAQRGSWTEAERWGGQAWALAQRQAAAVTGDQARQGFGSSIASLAATLLQAQVALHHVRAAFETMEEARAQALLRMLLERRVMAGLGNSRAWSEYRAATAARDQAEQGMSAASVDFTRAQRTLEAAQEQKLSAAALASLKDGFQAAFQRLAAAQSAYTQARLKADQLWGELEKGAPRAFAVPLSLARARQYLTAGELYAAFAVGPDRTYLFLLRAGHGLAPELTVSSINVSDTELLRLVQAFRSRVTDPESDPSEVIASGRALFARLVPAAAWKQIQAAHRLLLSPYGPLWDLPFAALVVNAHGPPRYLSEEIPLTYTPSLTLLAQSLRDRPRRPEGSRPVALVVGDPVFARPRGVPSQIAAGSQAGVQEARRPVGASEPVPGLGRPPSPPAPPERAFLLGDDRPPPRLPGTREEAIQVARLYHCQPLLGEAATEAAVRRQIERADIIHLATHGYLNPYQPMSSGVLLAAAAPGSEPGSSGDSSRNDALLQAWEIHSELRLRAELVVLSACETARGANVLGEGIVGLTRALEYAGARSVVASQWKVADASTRRLMITLHQRLLRGLPKDEALRQAMAVVRRDPRTAHPYYWAAFILTGDPGTLRARVRYPPRGARPPEPSLPTPHG